MADAIVKLSEDDTRRAVAAAVAAALTPEVMTRSLVYVLDEMMKEPKNAYGGDLRTPMRKLFDEAVTARAKVEVERLIVEEPNRSKIEKLVQDSLTLLLDDPLLRERMVSGIANAIATKIAGR
jgi:hypothetical protein